MTADPEHDVRVDHTDESVCVLSVRGELDLVTSPRLAHAVRDAVAGSATTIVIDLTDVTFLASTAMSVLVDAATTVTAPRRVTVVAAGAATHRPLTMVGLDQLLSIYPTRAAALTAHL